MRKLKSLIYTDEIDNKNRINKSTIKVMNVSYLQILSKVNHSTSLYKTSTLPDNSPTTTRQLPLNNPTTIPDKHFNAGRSYQSPE